MSDKDLKNKITKMIDVIENSEFDEIENFKAYYISILENAVKGLTKLPILPSTMISEFEVPDISHTARLNDKLKAAQEENLHNIEGNLYMRDARGGYAPLETIKPQDLLIDEQVRKIFVFATDLSQQIARFKGHSFEDVHALQSLLEQEYNARKGGAKGNVQFLSFDGLKKITIQIADQLYFGAELQTAKVLIDECLLEWGAGSHEVLRAIVNRVFSVEKQGQINRAELFSLLRVECEDERWQQAMRAIKDSIRVQGTKAYIRFYWRKTVDAGWNTISLDIANAEVQS